MARTRVKGVNAQGFYPILQSFYRILYTIVFRAISRSPLGFHLLNSINPLYTILFLHFLYSSLIHDHLIHQYSSLHITSKDEMKVSPYHQHTFDKPVLYLSLFYCLVPLNFVFQKISDFLTPTIRTFFNRLSNKLMLISHWTFFIHVC